MTSRPKPSPITIIDDIVIDDETFSEIFADDEEEDPVETQSIPEKEQSSAPVIRAPPRFGFHLTPPTPAFQLKSRTQLKTAPSIPVRAAKKQLEQGKTGQLLIEKNAAQERVPPSLSWENKNTKEYIRVTKEEGDNLVLNEGEDLCEDCKPLAAKEWSVPPPQRDLVGCFATPGKDMRCLQCILRQRRCSFLNREVDGLAATLGNTVLDPESARLNAEVSQHLAEQARITDQVKEQQITLAREVEQKQIALADELEALRLKHEALVSSLGGSSVAEGRGSKRTRY